MQKPARKNSHKGRIFSLPQNKIDFVYQKDHQNRMPKEQQTSFKKVEGAALLTANKARESLKNLEGWQITDDHKMIYREFILHDFMAAIDLIDRIALIAEAEKHHPDIHLTQYRNLRVGLTTHDVGGLSDNDFIIAMKINDAHIRSNKHNNGIAVDQQSQDKDPSINVGTVTINQPDQPKRKDKPVQKPRFDQKDVQLKQRRSISPVLKKNAGKLKGIKTKRSLQTMDQPIKKA